MRVMVSRESPRESSRPRVSATPVRADIRIDIPAVVIRITTLRTAIRAIRPITACNECV